MRKRGERVLGPYYTRGRWQLVYVQSDGTRTVASFESEGRAEASKRELEADITIAATTIDEAIDQYERYMIAKGNKPKSYKETVRRLRRFFPGHGLELGLLTAQRARKAYEAMTVHAVDTHRNMLAEAKTFLRWCVSQRWLNRSPLEDVVGLGRRSHGKLQLRLDEARAWRLKAHEMAGAGDAAVIAALMTLTMGLRVSEIVTRKVRDLDDGGRMLWVEEAKTKAGTRTVAVPEELQGYLRVLVDGRDREGWMFPGRKMNTHRYRKWPLLAVQRVCEAAKVPKVTAHGMRGLAATLSGAAAILDGRGLDAVAGTLGHVDTRTTEQSYADKAELERARRARTLQVLDGGKK
jgi:integrase